jgi:hypothetical protein
MGSSGSIAVGEVAEHIEVLALACNRCDRVGRYRLETLIARYEADFSIPTCCTCCLKIAQASVDHRL